jgi:hypothetical protein
LSSQSKLKPEQVSNMEDSRRFEIHRPSRTHSRLWFERVFSKLRLSFWSGTIIVGLLPALILWIFGHNINIETDFTGNTIVSVPLLVLNVLYLLIASRYISSRIEKLKKYTRNLGQELRITEEKFDLRRLYSVQAILVVWIAIVAATGFIFDPTLFGLHYSLYQSMLRVVVTGYLRFLQATFLWIFSYSMYSIYRLGKLPMKLLPFTEDKTLGLKPYGRISLSLISLYVIAVFLTFPILVYRSEAALVSQSIFYVLGLLIFIGPLPSLRKKLLDVKQEKLAWIRERHTRVMAQIEQTGDGPLDSKLVNELIAIDKIQQDLQQIRGWPFDLGIVARLATVMIVPLGLTIFSSYLIEILRV